MKRKSGEYGPLSPYTRKGKMPYKYRKKSGGIDPSKAPPRDGLRRGTRSYIMRPFSRTRMG